MSRTQYFCAASLDGFIAESDDTLEHLGDYTRLVTAGKEPVGSWAGRRVEALVAPEWEAVPACNQC